MKLTLIPLLFLLVISIHSFSQKTKEVVETNGDRYNKEKKEYNVLKDNPAIKHGPYEQSRNGKLAVTGYYKFDKKDSVWQSYDSRGTVVSRKIYAENKRVGTWRFFNRDGTLAWHYDFGTNSFQNQADTGKWYYTYQAANGEWINAKADKDPVMLRGNYEWQSFLNRTLHYPQDAVDNEKMGTILVDITVDENGDAIDYTVDQSVFKSLDDESIRVVKLFQPEFLPAEKDGKKVKSKVRQPIVFRIEH